MLKTDPENLHSEIRSATTYRENFLHNIDAIISRYYGRYYRKTKQPDRAVTDNHSYEYLSVMVPSVMYDSPRCRIRSANPKMTDIHGLFTMGDMARGIELFLNRWSEDSDISNVFRDLALDFFLTYSVAMVTIADQPGYSGSELVPQRPYVVRIPNHHFLMDSTATTSNPMQSDGPRWMGHMWKADKEDLLSDKNYNQGEIKKLIVDFDIEKYNPEHDSQELPKRDEILAWDVWVPEKTLTKEPGFNGVIYTVAVGNTKAGQTKKAYMIRKPRPAYCPPWGNYIMHGAYRVPNTAIPLSPVIATAEQAEELNVHTTAAAEDARAFKSFAYGDNNADGQRVRDVRNGEFVLLDTPETVGSMEIGGVKEAQYRYINFRREALNRASGMSDALRGETTGATATESSIADSGTKIRMSGIKREYRRFLAKIFKSAAWFAFYGEDVVSSLGDDGERIGMSVFQGGITERKGFNFFDMSLSIDPLSHEHTDQALLQRRVQLAYESLISTAPAMIQMPFINWREPVRTLFEVLNVGDADEWIDWQQLAMAQGQAQQQMAMAGAEGAEGAAGAGPMGPATPGAGGGGAGGIGAGQALVPRLGGDRKGIPSTETNRAATFMARETGRLNQDANTGT